MRTLLLLTAAALLSSSTALAEVFSSRDDFHFSLTRAALTSATDGDLHVSAVGVFAQYGAKRSSRDGEFQTREVVVLDEPYDVKDATGSTWRMWIRMSADRTIEVELMHQPVVSAPSQLFRAALLTIDGIDASPTFADLELTADGKYRLGMAHGRYQRDEAGVVLDGAASQWGRGTFSVDGQGLTFIYERGPSRWAVTYEQKAATTQLEVPHQVKAGI